MKSRLWNEFCGKNKEGGREIASNIDGYGDPLLVFWLDSDTWTVVTNQFLVGRLSGVASALSLDELHEVTTDNEMNLPPDDLKRRAQIVRVGIDRLPFWTPPGNDHFSLRNILGMFPMGN
ncbi:hypothetical protein [Pandoraea sputorum]|uniref:hypothetical protein n=1 Tax=Pandoraea sputorum TaxID=93222 RepID=UPI001241106C|nr:hypothetical protein [Pandoraea sputorum]